MVSDWINAYKDPLTCKALADRIRQISRRPVTFMEVCGTHTVSIFKSGIRNILPDHVTLLSGPGCPVCVTPVGDIDAVISMADDDDVLIATFGDLMRVPGSGGSLQEKRARGADVRMVYSVMDALGLAVKNPSKQVVFVGVGFETTAPVVAAAIHEARRMRLANFYVYCAHKLTPPAISAVMSSPSCPVEGLLLPGHVAVMTGADYFRNVAEESHRPCVITGFEPVDILRGILELVEAVESGLRSFVNVYERAVSPMGNRAAMELMGDVFDIGESRWRGIGILPGSGLTVSEEYSAFDAVRAFKLNPGHTPDPPECSCAEILTGRSLPPACPLYGTRCTPFHPVGPCMVSGEGTCAAYYHYDKN